MSTKINKVENLPVLAGARFVFLSAAGSVCGCTSPGSVLCCGPPPPPRALLCLPGSTPRPELFCVILSRGTLCIQDLDPKFGDWFSLYFTQFQRERTLQGRKTTCKPSHKHLSSYAPLSRPAALSSQPGSCPHTCGHPGCWSCREWVL